MVQYIMDKKSFKLEEHYRGNQTWLPERTIFLTAAGSQAYGTSTPASDLDVRGLAVPPKDILLGFSRSFEQVEIKGDPDVVIYGLPKFMKLAADCNPNIIELLHTDPSDWIKTTPAFELLYDHRSHFISKKAKYTFGHYAMSQLKRIKTHKRWLLEKPDHKPTREEYGLDLEHKVNASEMGAFDKLQAEGHEFDVNVMKLLAAEKQYQNALRDWNSYQEWKSERNVTRAALEEKYGYDSKHAGHLVRLMRMAREILTTGKVVVKRPDAGELLAIRNGAWSYEYLMEWAETQERELEELYKTSTDLPDCVNLDKLNSLCVQVQEMMLNT